MLQQENEAYGPYAPSYQQKPFESVAVLEDATATHAPAEQDTSPLPLIPPGPKAPLQAQNRQGRGGAILLFSLVLAIIFGVGLFAGLEYAGSSTGSTTTTTKSVATTTTTSSSGSTIETHVTTTQGEQIGSGVIIDTKGDIVTNYHIVNGEESITTVLYNGNKVQAQLVGTNTADDLAVVRIQPFANMTVAQIGDSSRLVVGQEVLAIGNPLGITETATKGIVSALNKSVTESTGTTISNAIQTDAAVNPGNSGGALINLQGQLIGIPTLTAVNTESNTAANGVSFAIPSNLVQTVVQQILQQ